MVRLAAEGTYLVTSEHRSVAVDRQSEGALIAPGSVSNVVTVSSTRLSIRHAGNRKNSRPLVGREEELAGGFGGPLLKLDEFLVGGQVGPAAFHCNPIEVLHEPGASWDKAGKHAGTLSAGDVVVVGEVSRAPDEVARAPD